MSTQIKIKDVLQRSPIFNGLTEPALERICAMSKIKLYEKGSQLFFTGDKHDFSYCVLDGRLTLSLVSGGGQAFILNELNSEYWLSHSMLSSHETETFTMEFKEAGHVLMISNADVAAAAYKYPQIFVNIIQYQQNVSRDLFYLLGSMMFYPMKIRLAKRVVALLSMHGRKEGQGYYLDLDISQQELALLVNGSRQKVNRIFKDWDQLGLVVRRDNRYYIPNLKNLKLECEAA